MSIPIVLSIAGSDCSAGAGLQADLKTISTLGCHGLTAVSCVVAETPLEVRSIHPVPIGIFRDQLEILLESYPIDAIKTGLLCYPEQITLVCELLKDSNIPLIIDPVMVASTGDALQQKDSLETLKDLLSIATVITPNLPEAEALLGKTIDEQTSAARELSAQFKTTCYLKGGHASPQLGLIDILTGPQGLEESFTADLFKIPQSHGTGCTLAAALAVGLAKKLPIAEAARMAHEFTQGAIRNSGSWGMPGTSQAIMHLDQRTNIKAVSDHSEV